MRESAPYRVAIVGFGPRGFGCLERLALEVAWRGSGGRPLTVTAHDPMPHPGAGPPYDPDQPDTMRLNFTARNVDIWSVDNDLVPGGERLDFSAWLGRNHPLWASGDAYVPRRLLGAYLRESFASLEAVLPAGLGFHQVRGRVRDLQFFAGGWSVRHDDPSLDLEGVDQVMVATGHGTWAPDEGSGAWERDLPVALRTVRIPAVYPVAERLSPGAVPDGSTVGVRGFALTAIDAIVALTEGRGGTFEERPSGIPHYGGRGKQDVTVVPFSRSGRPLLAKSGAALTERSNELGDLWGSLRREIREATHLTPGSLLERLRRAGARAVVALGGQVGGPLSRAGEAAPARALQVMEQSIRVASGLLPPDEAWARGEAWRQAYPAVVARAGEGGLAAAFPTAFDHLARDMERYAFGPPAANLARMVSLARAGRLDLGALHAPLILARKGHLVLEGVERMFPLDVLVNAVIPRPGVHDATPLLQRLVQRGHASRAPGWDGVVVSPSAESIGRSGGGTPGLSVVGRATEGWIVGNDTLSRTLHDHTRRWAHRVLSEASRSASQAGPLGAGAALR